MPRGARPAKTPAYAAPALEKGLDILELLSRVSRPMGLSEISQEISRSKSEIFRMLIVLERRQYIERAEDSDLYTLTNRLFLLGMEKPPLKGLLDIALPAMHQLSDDTQQSCHLVVPSGPYMVVIARIDPPADLGLVVRIGHRRSILEGTSGVVLTAFQLEAVRRNWIQQYGGNFSAKERAELEIRLKEIAVKGYYAHKSTVVPGITDISVPVMRSGVAVAALAIPYMKRTGVPVSQTDATSMLKGVAAAISAKLV